jgi:hypothetical protein
VDLFLKLVPGLEPEARAETLRLLTDEGVRDVRRLFPDATDADLKNHYVAAVDTAAELKRLVRLLGAREEVEFVHAGEKRSPRHS